MQIRHNKFRCMEFLKNPTFTNIKITGLVYYMEECGLLDIDIVSMPDAGAAQEVLSN